MPGPEQALDDSIFMNEGGHQTILVTPHGCYSPISASLYSQEAMLQDPQHDHKIREAQPGLRD